MFHYSQQSVPPYKTGLKRASESMGKEKGNQTASYTTGHHIQGCQRQDRRYMMRSPKHLDGSIWWEITSPAGMFRWSHASDTSSHDAFHLSISLPSSVISDPSPAFLYHCLVSDVLSSTKAT